MIKKDTQVGFSDFDSIRLSVTSPEQILTWSHGEVTKPETINYRTQKPEREGLFDEKIFGPVKDYECYCGKYKKIRYKGVVCDRCGVEVTRSSVRRDRMGHIDLAVPVSHIWYVRGVPSIIGTLLGLTTRDLERVIYFGAFIVLSVDDKIRSQSLEQLEQEYKQAKGDPKTDQANLEQVYRGVKQNLIGLKPMQVISEDSYFDLTLKYGQIVNVGIGSQALYQLLKQIDVEVELTKAKQQDNQISAGQKKRLIRRIQLLTDLKSAGIAPSWFIFTRLPVMPPDLRPMVQLDGGRFAASDLNDLYRRVLNRNNRLKKLIASGAPEVITRNEKRMLQEAVDALIDNSNRRSRSVTTGSSGRKLRSLSDMLRGKQGRFRQNLLGKRVDYSGRSVIVVGPELNLNECGLPKVMALELFKPFVIGLLMDDGIVHNVKNAVRLIQQATPEVWDALERVTRDSWVLLNRAPTLHRLGIQAFKPILIEGKAIKIHPLVCAAYNADFDGDQMAVHVPLSAQALDEAKFLMGSNNNVLKPASGEPIINANYDIVFGCFWLTQINPGAKGEKKFFASKNEAIAAYQQEVVDPRAIVTVRLDDQLVETTVGRILFNNILPDGHSFVNEVMTSKRLKKILVDVNLNFGREATVEVADKMKDLGFFYASQAGLTISIEDLVIPQNKQKILELAGTKVELIENQYQEGLLGELERDAKVIEVWTKAREEIEKLLESGLPKENPIRLMVDSGARGSFAQVLQMAGMKGLVVNPAGQIITVPIKASFKEGLSVYEYFISTHGARKGKSDTSLRTSDAGYLTRRLVDVSQDVVILDKDCGSEQGLLISASDSGELTPTFEARLLGRVLAQNVKIPGARLTLFKKGQLIDESVLAQLIDHKISQVLVRSPLYCLLEFGLCQNCYGRNLANGQMARQGDVVGIMAAQAIGEPGTQLTMRTFHTGGVAGEQDVTQGLPRVEELFEARVPKRPAVMAEIEGIVTIQNQKDGTQVVRLTSKQPKNYELTIPLGYDLLVKVGDKVKARQIVAQSKAQKPIRALLAGRLKSEHQNKIVIVSQEQETIDYSIGLNATLIVKPGESVTVGQPLTDDHWDIGKAMHLAGWETVAKYLLFEVQKIYLAQGQNIHDKHIELIIRQMLSKAKILDPGQSSLAAGQLVSRNILKSLNRDLAQSAKRMIVFEDVVLGITRMSIKTGSFLSAASFQETTNVLINAAVRGSVDTLRGLKENVIIGRLIPAGTGLSGDDYLHDLPAQGDKAKISAGRPRS